ncbi:hypothetical protein GGR56DRAFT_160824 [Xylariaceae sp. FL0804]|nr:hypothetical protein GGR56DRAFT_160824 [Xylariaceae sp. FL0804]
MPQWLAGWHIEYTPGSDSHGFVTGRPVPLERLRDASYWTDNIILPVRFSDALLNLTRLSAEELAGGQTITDIIEVSPHSTLQRPVMATLSEVSNRIAGSNLITGRSYEDPNLQSFRFWRLPEICFAAATAFPLRQ